MQTSQIFLNVAFEKKKKKRIKSCLKIILENYLQKNYIKAIILCDTYLLHISKVLGFKYLWYCKFIS